MSRSEFIRNSYYSTIMRDKPLVYYRLGELSGTTANDASGNGYNGTIAGGVTLGAKGALAGDPNAAMGFDGNTGYIYSNAGFAASGAMSIEAWGYDTGMSSVHGLGGLLALNGNNTYIDIEYDDTSLRFEIKNGGGGQTYVNGSFLNQWLYVVATYNATTGGGIGYINGVQVATTSTTAGNLFPNAWQIASWDSKFAGKIDEAAIYNYILSADQVARHYQAGLDAGIIR